ncbi:MAG: hypothetical protein GY791_14980 [Alphaproteobacteria bacterium]|nr:hypothetical protein [Alphaproteobacteria bacterium]
MLVSVALVIAVMAFDFWAYARLPWDKWPVISSGSTLVRSVVIAMAAAGAVVAVRPDRLRHDRRPLATFFPYYAALSAASLVMIGGAACLLVLDPGVLFLMAREDELIEDVSAFALVVAGLTLIFIGWTGRGRFMVLGWPISARLPYFLIGAVLMLIFLEEVSWGQRLLGFDTPEFMDENRQGEFNIHNFFTFPAEQAYYSSMLLAFVLLPYATIGPRSDWPPLAAALVPVPAFAIVAAPLAFLQSEMWTTVPMQFAAWGTLIIVIDLARVAETGLRYWCVLVAAVCAAAQVVFLTHSGSLVRAWELTEYRETLIALLVAAYAVSALQNARRRTADT